MEIVCFRPVAVVRNASDMPAQMPASASGLPVRQTLSTVTFFVSHQAPRLVNTTSQRFFIRYWRVAH